MKELIRGIYLAAIFACAAGAGFASAGDDKPDRIFWTDRNALGFDDFKGNPSKDSGYAGIADIVLAKTRKSIVVRRKEHDKFVKFRIYAVMYREHSWIKHKNDSASLRHEQAHFDICEIYARLLRKEIAHVRSVNQARRTFEEITFREQVEQNWFDKDNAGSDEGINKFWSERISKRLEELEAYENPVVYIIP